MLHAIWTQTVVLAITAGLIYWYIIETSGLRKQMVRQNEIALRPVIVPVFDNRGGEPIFKLENIGVGVAFNVTAEPLIEVRLIEPGHELRHEFRFSRLSHLGSKQGGEIQFLRFMNGILNLGPHPAYRSFLPEPGEGRKAITIVFDDVEGGRYRCGIMLVPPAQLGKDCLVELLPIEKVGSYS
jgi:hypothetical protein